MNNNLGMGLSQGISSALQTFMTQLPGVIQQHNKQSNEKAGQSILSEWDANNPEQQPIIQQQQQVPLDPNGQTVAPMEQMSMAQPNVLDPRVNPEIQPVPRAETALQELATPQGPSLAVPIKRSKAMENLDQHDHLIKKYAEKYNVPYKLAKSIAGLESGGVATAVSPTGVEGLMQVTKGTTKAMGYDPKNRADPDTSFGSGIKYISEIKKNHPEWTDEQVWTSYNAGPGIVGPAIKAGGENWLKNVEKKVSPAKFKEITSGLANLNRYSKEIDLMGGSGFQEQSSESKSLLTNMGGFKEATETLDALMGEVKAGAPKYEKGRYTKKLEDFYSKASPDVVAAMEPVIKKLESMSADEKAEFSTKVDSWAKETDSQIKIAIAKAQLAATMEWKANQETGKANALKFKTEAEKALKEKKDKIDELKLLSANLKTKIAENNDIIAQSSKKGSNKEDFMLKHPDLFYKTEKPSKTFGGLAGMLGFTNDEIIIKQGVAAGLNKQLENVNSQLAKYQSDFEASFNAINEQYNTEMPSTGGAASNDINKYFTPVE